MGGEALGRASFSLRGSMPSPSRQTLHHRVTPGRGRCVSSVGGSAELSCPGTSWVLQACWISGGLVVGTVNNSCLWVSELPASGASPETRAHKSASHTPTCSANNNMY